MPAGAVILDGSHREALKEEPVSEAAPEVPEAPEPAECRTAFTIFIMASGEVLVTRDLGYGEIRVERPPTFDEMTYAAFLVQQEYATPVGDELAKPGEWVALTAFSPYLTHDGRWLISADLNDPLVPDRAVSSAERVGACSVVLRDLQTQEAATGTCNLFAQTLGPQLIEAITRNVIANFMQMGQAIREQAEGQRIAAQLEADKNRRGGQ